MTQPAGEMEPALTSRDRGDVAGDLRVGPVRVEAAPDQVRCQCGLGVLPGQTAPPGALAVPDDAVLPHDPLDALVVHQPALAAQFGRDPGHPVGSSLEARWITVPRDPLGRGLCPPALESWERRRTGTERGRAGFAGAEGFPLIGEGRLSGRPGPIWRGARYMDGEREASGSRARRSASATDQGTMDDF